jgi:hypothetical protein
VVTSADAEARVFAGLVARGVSTIDRARALIGISEAEESDLRRLLHRGDVDRIVCYRRRILGQFDLLIAETERRGPAKRRLLSKNGRNCPHSTVNRREITHAF